MMRNKNFIKMKRGTKMKKKMNGKKAITAAMAALAMTVMMGGTMAYLTDNESAANNFTVGKVDIEGSEPNWNPDGGTEEDIVPTESFDKDPQIKNVGKNPAYVYMEVAVPVADVIYANAQGTRQNSGNAAHIELFEFDTATSTVQTLTDGVGVSEQNDSWTQMYKKEVDGKMVYTFSYNSVLNPEETTDPLFNKVTFANIVEGQLDGQALAVDVKFYAIQAENTGDGADTVPAQAKNAYDKYLKQNAGLSGAAINDVTAGD